MRPITLAMGAMTVLSALTIAAPMSKSQNEDVGNNNNLVIRTPSPLPAGSHTSGSQESSSPATSVDGMDDKNGKEKGKGNQDGTPGDVTPTTSHQLVRSTLKTIY